MSKNDKNIDSSTDIDSSTNISVSLDTLLGKLYAILKKTGEKKKVKIINIDQKQVYLHGDKWGTRHNYSKRGDVTLFVA